MFGKQHSSFGNKITDFHVQIMDAGRNFCKRIKGLNIKYLYKWRNFTIYNIKFKITSSLNTVGLEIVEFGCII